MCIVMLYTVYMLLYAVRDLQSRTNYFIACGNAIRNLLFLLIKYTCHAYSYFVLPCLNILTAPELKPRL